MLSEEIGISSIRYVKLHGGLQIVAWYFCLNQAFIAWKYIKAGYPNAIWHTFLIGAALFYSVIAIIIAFLNGDGYGPIYFTDERYKYVVYSHMPVGLITLGFLIFYILFVYFKRVSLPGSTYTSVDNVIWTAIVIFSNAAVGIGLVLPLTTLISPYWLIYLLFVFIVGSIYLHYTYMKYKRRLTPDLPNGLESIVVQRSRVKLQMGITILVTYYTITSLI
ncbi:hypothetical protein A3Q56_07709, partial [Intoshia linei]